MIANHQYVENVANERLTCEKCGAQNWSAMSRTFTRDVRLGSTQSVKMVCRHCGRRADLTLDHDEAIEAGFDLSPWKFGPETTG